jgi:hypothetical protein
MAFSPLMAIPSSPAMVDLPLPFFPYYLTYKIHMVCPNCNSNNKSLVYERKRAGILPYMLGVLLIGAAIQAIIEFNSDSLPVAFTSLAGAYGCWYWARSSRNTVFSFKCNNPPCGHQWDKIM